MVVAILLDALFPPDNDTSSDNASSGDEDLRFPIRKKIKLFGGCIETEADALFNSILEDLNFCIDWVYVDWVFGNRCSSKTFKGAVLGLGLLATLLYLVHASNVLKRATNIASCFPCCCPNRLMTEATRGAIRKRIYVFLIMLVVLEGIPQIALTLSFNFAIANDNDCVGFAAQAASNLLTSSLVVLRRLLKIFEYHNLPLETQKRSEREDASLSCKATENVPAEKLIPGKTSGAISNEEMPKDESTGPSCSDDHGESNDIEEARSNINQKQSNPPRQRTYEGRQLRTHAKRPPRRPFISKNMRSETM